MEFRVCTFSSISMLFISSVITILIVISAISKESSYLRRTMLINVYPLMQNMLYLTSFLLTLLLIATPFVLFVPKRNKFFIALIYFGILAFLQVILIIYGIFVLGHSESVYDSKWSSFGNITALSETEMAMECCGFCSLNSASLAHCSFQHICSTQIIGDLKYRKMRFLTVILCSLLFHLFHSVILIQIKNNQSNDNDLDGLVLLPSEDVQ